jgi:hypothetical protein
MPLTAAMMATESYHRHIREAEALLTISQRKNPPA